MAPDGRSSAKLKEFKPFLVSDDKYKPLTGKEVPVRNIERELRRFSKKNGWYHCIGKENRNPRKNYFNAKTRIYCPGCHLAMGIAEAEKGELCNTCKGRAGL